MRAIIADDHPMVRDATASLLRDRYGAEADIRRVGTYDALLLALEMGRTDLIVVDLDMPDLSPSHNLTTVTRKSGEVPLIVFSSSRAVSVIRSARQQGAHGYVCKADSPDTLLAALETVLAGGEFFPDELTAASEAFARFLPNEAALHAASAEGCSAPGAKDRPELPPLTPRQQEILHCLGLGLANKEIGRRLGISDSTVKVHMHGLFERLGVQNRTQAALLARRCEGEKDRDDPAKDSAPGDLASPPLSR
ncbi:LuxR C-terminal-related transcriptional regulator [Algihabitans albus]|uniref:LuxR C-terminal-related transcriptional regulator n=1 Tax=Algihabitans albus TaxID=2164067 RepID=UPI000E5C5D2C|nr:response regulator transcription factor [Algihabitans albus]